MQSEDLVTLVWIHTREQYTVLFKTREKIKGESKT